MTNLLLLILLLTTAAAVYALAKLDYQVLQESVRLTNDEFKTLVLSIVEDTKEFDMLIDEDPSGSYIAEVQLLDDKNHVLWSRDLDVDSLKGLGEVYPDVADEDKEYPWYNQKSFNRMVRSVNRKEKKYVVAHEMRFVNCNRFRPIQRGKYLMSPSIRALYTCYKYGVYRNELEHDIVRNENEILRYDLENLFVPCEVAFDEHLDDMTDELKDDYAKCRWYGGLSNERQRFIEERFADKLATDEAHAIIQSTPVTLTNGSLDIQAYVECSHVETELFEDYFESPSYEALQRCHDVGVTAEELTRGIAMNPQPNITRSDLGILYVSCMDVFGRNIEYITSELKDDYRRCKRVGAITKEVQEAVERKFYEALNGAGGIAEKPTIYDTTTVKPLTSSQVTTTTETTTTSTEVTRIPNRYAFAGCRRVENKTYLICIKIIKVYSTPMQLRVASAPSVFAH